ncbi:cupin domain-containing protein [Nocardia sp. NPDC052112]|uniref:JmjC domain-containing protein n=1 Tax=Nocardia sp. NPDC052112 TaxID=3155646 RepID=UPI003449CEDB
MLFENLVPAEVLGSDDVLEGLRRLRRAAANGEQTSARTRVYVGEDRRDDVVNAVLSASWEADEEFVGWMRRLCGAERFSLVINNLETTSPVLSSVLGELIQSAFTGWGVPMGGCEQVAFAGNYAGTAFGVHEGHEDAFLVHLGPGVKHFYCWSRPRYQELTGGGDPTFGDYRWLLEQGQRFDLTPGSVLFLPRHVFHVGVQDEFSISVAIPLYTYPDARLLTMSILPQLLDSVANNTDVPSPMHALSAGPRPISDRLAKAAGAMLIEASGPLASHVHEHIEQRWHTLLSNGGWESVEHDLARSDSAREAVEALAAGGNSIRVRPPFTLHSTRDIDDSLSVVVTVRGVTISVPESPDWGRALSALADGAAVELTDALRSTSTLEGLLGTGGIQVLTDESR